jgi:hypothetical protein
MHYIVLDCQRLPFVGDGNHVIRTCNLIYEMCMCVRVRERERAFLSPSADAALGIL